MSLDPHRRRRPLARPPARGRRRQPRPGAGRQGQRLRLRPRPAGPQGASGWASTPSRSAPTTSCPRSPTGSTATCWCSPRGGPFGPTSSSTPAPAPGDPHRRPARRTSTPCSTAQPDARFVLERLTSMQRHGLDRARAARRPAERSARSAVGAGSRASPCTCRWRRAPTSPRSSGCSPTWSPPSSPTTHRLGQPPDRRRAGRAARGVRRLHDPAADRHRPVARRPRRAAASPRPCSTCTRSSAATRSATAAAPRPRPATCWSSAAAPRTASAWRRRRASRRSRPAPRPSPAAAWTRPASCARRSAIDGKQRLFAEPPHMQASMLFLPARRRGARRSATRSTCGSATPRRRSTGSIAADRRSGPRAVAHRVVLRATRCRARRSRTR